MGAVIKTITKGADKLFEEVIEKPGKKIIQETNILHHVYSITIMLSSSSLSYHKK